ncbi:hypothetical protein H4P12_03130 [Paracoccus sp. 11-3]|uniref:Lipoprotein n=1 Tax=Paracoccus amoyensis TaxID=2760093 RepID=A0A926JA75_9RHOB|nr:hypothetical protein [Paracoccus amoyensis]MBC9245726.1 hypothetical protein [Paracoccus amoyensis]
MRHSCLSFIRILSLLLLSGCATPSPDMMDSVRREMTVDGMTFTVFHDFNEAEVVRMGGYMTMKERDRVPALISRAAELASGCRVIPGSMTARLPGDSGVARFELDC